MHIDSKTSVAGESGTKKGVEARALVDTHRLGCRLTLSAGHGLVHQVAGWIAQGRRGYVCVANTHQVAQAQAGTDLHTALDNALAVTSDSQILGKALRQLGTPYPDAVLYGPDLMQAIIHHAACNSLSVALFGSTPETCEAVIARIGRDHPTLVVRGAICPPVQPLDSLVNGRHAKQLQALEADIVLVSLGCPKQELWMYQTDATLPGVKIGLGGAFEFYAGRRNRSPAWVHRAGLEWLYRLCCEPRRLLKRYLVNNPAFVWIWLRAQLWRPPVSLITGKDAGQ